MTDGERLRATLYRCLDAHLLVAAEYERGGNVGGAIQLRAVANLLDVILQGGEPATVLPPGRGALARRNPHG